MSWYGEECDSHWLLAGYPPFGIETLAEGEGVVALVERALLPGAAPNRRAGFSVPVGASARLNKCQ